MDFGGEATIKINPNLDGISHINIYSQGKTELGRMLTNFAKFPIHTSDGDFMSVEGYWYWLSIEDCPEKEKLRGLCGFTAKKYGKSVLEYKASHWDDDFERKILKAIWWKFKRNTHLLIPQYYDLPFKHYYNFGGCIRDVAGNYPWMMEGIEKMRKYLVEKGDVNRLRLNMV